jgi:FlaA1/EpsC-like NDP-sugar epimerase
MLTRQRSWVVVSMQSLLVTSSALLAWLLRFDFRFVDRNILLSALPILILMRISAMARFNLCHGYWRYTGVSDAFDITKAVAVGSAGFFISIRWVLGNSSFPLSVYMIEAVLTAMVLAGVRVTSRALMQHIETQQLKATTKSTLIIGAGSAGAMLIPELRRSGYLPIGLIDDDPVKLGVPIHGVPVLGSVEDLPALVRLHQPSEVLIAIPSATGKQMRRITDYCQKSGARFRTIPGLTELIDGTVTVDQLRNVSVEDLLGREPVKFNSRAVREVLSGRVVMVTGAAGSIGSELCRQILKYHPARLICVDQAETPLFYLQLANAKAGSQALYYVADITDTDRMRSIITENGVRAIFHAAAYKHVPLMEENVSEALKNNVFGLVDLLKIAEECGCEDFLLISSDKAVNPSSLMGCTKRLGEMILAARQDSAMRCVSVRFGNVMGSQGSVIPLFQEQIRTERRVTVTHPDITRYFMTIPESVALVLQAFTVGARGDILVLDMGEPMRIVDLARSLIKMSGMSEDDVRIVYTGLRPGEKLFEELFYSTEEELPTSVRKIRRTRSKMLSWPELKHGLDAIRLAVAAGDDDVVRQRVKELIPQYAWRQMEPAPIPSTHALATSAAGTD